MTVSRKTPPPRPSPSDTGSAAKPQTPDQAHLDDLLDEALEETFPASDPIAPIDPFRTGTSDDHGGKPAKGKAKDRS